jgi:hypothetical protein
LTRLDTTHINGILNIALTHEYVRAIHITIIYTEEEEAQSIDRNKTYTEIPAAPVNRHTKTSMLKKLNITGNKTPKTSCT